MRVLAIISCSQVRRHICILLLHIQLNVYTCKYIVAINENTNSVVDMPAKLKRIKYRVYESHRACKNHQDLVKKAKCYLTRVHVDDRAKNNREYPWHRVASPSQSQNRWDTLTRRTTRHERELNLCHCQAQVSSLSLISSLISGRREPSDRSRPNRSKYRVSCYCQRKWNPNRTLFCLLFSCTGVRIVRVLCVFVFASLYVYMVYRSISLKIYTF